MEVINRLLETSEHGKYLNNVDGTYIVLNPSWERIVVSLSGGVDSAMVMYQLSRIISEQKLNIEVHVISNIRMWETKPWAADVSLQVYEYFCKKFPNITYKRHVNFIAPDIEFGRIGAIIPDRQGKMKGGCQISSRSFMEYIVATNHIDAAYDGVTLNPPLSVATDGMADRTLEKLDTTTLNDTIAYIPEFNAYMISPFKFVSKDWVVKQYVDYKILDLLHLTRSCEYEFPGLTYKNYKRGQHVPTCGKCFWCVERSWALKQNNL